MCHISPRDRPAGMMRRSGHRPVAGTPRTEEGETMQPPSPKFTIVGSGLAGTLLACYLGRAGVPVDLYEKRSDPRKQGADGGRSINLALSVRGIHALQEVGVADEVLRTALAMPGRMIHGTDGSLHFQPYGKDVSQAIHSVSRAGLNVALLDAVEK